MGEDGQSVELSAELVQRIEARTEVTEFDSVRAYIEFTMQEVLDELEDSADTEDDADQSKVRDRLESLGYVDE